MNSLMTFCLVLLALVYFVEVSLFHIYWLSLSVLKFSVPFYSLIHVLAATTIVDTDRDDAMIIINITSRSTIRTHRQHSIH